MKTFLIIILSIGILLQFYFGDKEITKWRSLARENHTELSDCIRKNGNLSEACDGLLKELNKPKDTVFVYEGYIHPSGDYKWTKKGWQALRPFFKLSADSTRLIPIK